MNRLLRPVPLFLAGLVALAAGIALSNVNAVAAAVVALAGLALLVASPFTWRADERGGSGDLPHGPEGLP